MDHFSFIKKTTAALLVAMFIVPFLILPKPAEAQVIVELGPVSGAVVAGAAASAATTAAHSTSQETKESLLNGIAWAVAKTAIQSITKSIVTWINSGFNGSPAFVTDLKSHLLGIGDGVTNAFVLQLTTNSKISSPFLNSVINGVATAYYLSTNKDAILTRLKYDLSSSVQNDRAFLSGQFTQGGFNGWFAASQKLQNNPLGAQLVAQDELSKRIDSAVNQRLTELSWGKGFQAWRNCPKAPAAGATALSNADTCSNAPIQTPGAFIESQLENVAGSGIRQLELADSFNEIVSALMGQLVNQALGGAGGLSGTTQASAGNTTPYLSQATNDTSANTSLQQSFLTTLDGFTTNVNAFVQNWTIIKNAAQEAKDALLTCPTDSTAATDVLGNTVQPVLVEADKHLTDAANALASTTVIRTKASAIVSTSADQSALFLDLSNQYSALIASISAEEFTDAQVEATDSTNPLSTYTHMRQIISELSNPRIGCATVN